MGICWEISSLLQSTQAKWTIVAFLLALFYSLFFSLPFLKNLPRENVHLNKYPFVFLSRIFRKGKNLFIIYKKNCPFSEESTKLEFLGIKWQNFCWVSFHFEHWSFCITVIMLKVLIVNCCKSWFLLRTLRG